MDARFWYHDHDLICEIADCWQVTDEYWMNIFHMHANVIEANTFKLKSSIIIRQVLLPYWHVIDINVLQDNIASG